MRGVPVAILTLALLWVGGLASAQGLGDLAARERQKRKAEGNTTEKVYTEDDLGPSLAPVSSLPETLPSEAEEEGSGEGTAEGEAEAAAVGDEQEQAEAAWRQQLEQARKEAQVYEDVVGQLQLELNDMSGGIYNPGRASKVAFLEENQQLLAETRQRIAALEEEGRRKGYR